MAAAPRLRTLTSLRFLAALFIVAYHTLPAWPGLNYLTWPAAFRAFLGLACVGLPFFYALSGFVLFYVYRREIPRTKSALMHFARKRFARLAPVFYLGLLVSAPFAWEAIRRNGEGGWEAFTYARRSAEFLSAWFPSSLVFNFPTWSVSVEAFCYAVFPFVLPAIARLKPRGAVVGLSLTFAVGALIQGIPAWLQPALLAWPEQPGSVAPSLTSFLQLNPLVHLPEFLFGVFLARSWEENPEGWGDATLAIGLAATALIVSSGLPLPWLMTTSFLFLPLLALVILGGAGPRGPALAWLERPLFVELGEMTYVTYVLHFPLSQYFLRWFPAGGVPSYVGFFLSLLGVSWLVHRFFELPLRRRIAGEGRS